MGSQPASQIGREAASSAPSASARACASARCSGALMPRPTATMRSACDRSTACLASWNGASGAWRIDAASMATSSVRTGAGVAPLATPSARKAPIWIVTSHGASPRGRTSAASLPWYIGRERATWPCTCLIAVQSVTRARSSDAARAGAKSRVW
jgi:hypothetical protein